MKIMLVAYSIEDGCGSEPGVGYNFCKGIAARFKDVTLVTHPRYVQALRSDPNFAHVKIQGIDVLPQLSRMQDNGYRELLYYFLWQISVGLHIYSLQKQQGDFDIIHHITLTAAWTPHFIFSKTAKIYVGPVTTHENVPRDFWFDTNRAFYRKEMFTRALKYYFFYMDPFLRWGVHRAHMIFVGCPAVPSLFRKGRHTLVESGGSDFPVQKAKDPGEKFSVLSVGRFIDLKGCIPALEAFRKFYDGLSDADRGKVSFDFIGQGPIEGVIKQRAQGLPVHVHKWMKQSELAQYYDRAATFLFPSFESQGLVVTEALSFGCPVICLEGTGPADLAGDAGIVVSKRKFSQTVDELAQSLKMLFDEYMTKPEAFRERSRQAVDRAKALSWDNKIKRVIEAYGE